MRVIAGKLGGRKLQAPKGCQTRPTTDRVKEALFSILADTVVEAQVLDLFAGSGALGIEALSRGASAATFVEQAKSAAAALRANIEATALAKCSTVLTLPVHKACALLAAEGRSYNIILLDPPYAGDWVAQTLQLIVTLNLLSSAGTIVAEHSGKSPSPEAPSQLQCRRIKRYGDVALSFYEFTS